MRKHPSLKPGQTCRYKGEWATLSYFVSPGQAIITYDDDTQERVDMANITVPGAGTMPRIYTPVLLSVRRAGRKKQGGSHDYQRGNRPG